MANDVDASSELSKIAKLNGGLPTELRHAHRSYLVSPHRERRPPKPLALGRSDLDRLFDGAELVGAAFPS